MPFLRARSTARSISSLSCLFAILLWASSHVPFSICRKRSLRTYRCTTTRKVLFVTERRRVNWRVYHCIVIGIMNFIMNNNVTGNSESQTHTRGGDSSESRKVNVEIASDDSIIRASNEAGTRRRTMARRRRKKMINKQSSKSVWVNERMKMCDK